MGWILVAASVCWLIALSFGGLVSFWLGLAVGILVAWLGNRIHALERRLAALEDRVYIGRTKTPSSSAQPDMATPASMPAAPTIEVPVPPPGQPAVPAFEFADVLATPAAPPPLPPSPPMAPPVETAPAAEGFGYSAQVSEPGPVERAIDAVKRWFTEGNVPVKVGMLVLFAGVAALLKYAADSGWLTVPIELRLAGIAAAATAALGFAWRQRERRRVFALSLQGGAIGILMLTVFAAFRLYHLLPASTAFALLVVLVAGIGLLAVLQDALALAVLGILAGFAAPILISTGSGNHVALFSYYAILNLAIFAIAWVRAWRVLNLLGFAFTFLIGTAWGVMRYQPALFDSTEPFLLLFFGIYLFIPILFALRRGVERADAIDASLVFANPLLAFGLQAALLDGARHPLALSAIVLALVYVVLAATLIRRIRALGESYAVLALGFATLAIPLALTARTSGCLFALEGAALVWFGLRQQRRLPRWIGLLLQVLAAIAFVIAWHPQGANEIPLANGQYLGAVLIAAAAFVSAWLYLRVETARVLSTLLYLWGLLWWLLASLVEIERNVSHHAVPAAAIALFAFSAWLAAEAWRRMHRPAHAITTAVLAWLIVPMMLVIFFDDELLTRPSLLAAMAVVVLGWRSLICLREAGNGVLATTHLAWLWTWLGASALTLHALASEFVLGDGWRFALFGAPLLVALGLNLGGRRVLGVPLADRFAGWRTGFLVSVILALVIALIASLVLPGAAHPLPFVPLLNPLELFQLGAMLLLGAWLSDPATSPALRQHRASLLAGIGFVMITAATLRGVHHLGGLPWDENLLASNLSQTALTVVWSILGVGAWVLGSRRGRRSLWLAGALLMAVVLAKLVLVDREHLGNLFGIGSFIAYGLLCTLVGYLAPAPPRATPAQESP